MEIEIEHPHTSSEELKKIISGFELKYGVAFDKFLPDGSYEEDADYITWEKAVTLLKYYQETK